MCNAFGSLTCSPMSIVSWIPRSNLQSQVFNPPAGYFAAMNISPSTWPNILSLFDWFKGNQVHVGWNGKKWEGLFFLIDYTTVSVKYLCNTLDSAMLACACATKEVFIPLFRSFVRPRPGNDTLINCSILQKGIHPRKISKGQQTVCWKVKPTTLFT